MEISAEAKKRLSALIEERDMPLAPLAVKIGVSQSTLWNFVFGNTKNFSKLHRLATELKISLDWILNGDPATNSAKNAPAASHLSEPSSGHGFKYPANLIPLLSLKPGEKNGEVERHPAQKDAKGAFAIYVTGETMAPRYRPGEIAYAIAKPPAKGQDCIIELTNGDSLLREFIARKGARYLCQQLNPAKEVTWRASEVKALHAVVGRG